MGFERILKRLLEYGVLAPSIYNSQPWKFSLNLDQGVVEIFADSARTRPSILDAKGRDLYLALGACLEHMALAAPGLGYEVKEDLFPSDGPRGIAARLSLKPLPETMPEPLFAALLTRQTHGGKYKPGTVKDIHLERLKHCGTFSPDEKIYFITEEPALSSLITLLHDLSHEGSGDPNLVAEGARWLTPQREAPEGLPLDTLGLPISVKARFAALGIFGYQREIKEVSRQTLLRQGHGIEAPAFLLATTTDATPGGFFRSGRWQAQLALTLSELELGSQALHLPITLASGPPALRGIFGAGPSEEAVFLLRFGQPEIKKWPKTFRRPVEQSILK